MQIYDLSRENQVDCSLCATHISIIEPCEQKLITLTGKPWKRKGAVFMSFGRN